MRSDSSQFVSDIDTFSTYLMESKHRSESQIEIVHFCLSLSHTLNGNSFLPFLLFPLSVRSWRNQIVIAFPKVAANNCGVLVQPLNYFLSIFMYVVRQRDGRNKARPQY